MSNTKTDLRQTIFRGTVPQLSTSTNPEGDNLVSSIASDLTALLRLNSNASLVVNVGASDLLNSESNRRRAIAHIGKTYISFSSGTVTFPAASGGNIVSSPGGSTLLTCPTGQFSAVLIYLDATSSLNTLAGPAAASEALAIAALPPAPNNTLAIGFVVVSNVGGVIQNIAQSAIRQFAIGSGGGGSGTGSGIGDDLNALTFKASFSDNFDDLPSDAISAVDYSAGRTDSTTYDIVNGYHRLAYDSSKTVTGTGTAMTISATPAFTIKIGDILVVGNQARRITAVATQTSITIESAFTTNPAAAACTLSQAVYTKDLNNFSVDGLPISNVYTTTISQVLATYDDTQTINDIILDNGVIPNIAFTASSDNSAFSSVSLRPVQLSSATNLVDLPTAGTNLFLRFFANKSTGSGFVNILGYRAFFHRDAAFADGSILNQAYCFTNGVGTEINCLPPSIVAGKTRIQTTFTFPVGVNAGTTNGSIKVYLNGQKIPRFVDAILTPDASYREIDERTIELDTDYSASALSLEVIQDVAVVDNLDVNSTNIAYMQEATGEGFQAFVQSSVKMNPTTAVGTPAAGTFHSTIQNRKAMQELRSDLGVRLGIERIPVQALYEIQNEFGSTGQRVWGVVNDSLDRIRFVGNWSSAIGGSGNIIFSGNNIVDFVEITFYGTGLNALLSLAGATKNIVASVDGGTESANILSFNASSLIGSRNYAGNTVVSIANNLSLGVHTVRIRNNTASDNFVIHGFEILNESTSLRIQPGAAYLNNKKLVLNSQQTLAFDSVFESGTLGARGGRVVTYLKPDGTIAKTVRPVDAAQLNLAAADHSNEEVARVYNWREFGANRADDFSTLAGSASSRAFTLDDGTTSLVTSNASTSAVAGGLTLPTNSNTISFTFVGTGLDVILNDNSALTNTNANSFTWSVDGSVIGNHETTGIVGVRTKKIVSGLSYGTHTVVLTRNAPDNFSTSIISFIAYQPRKPAVPTGVVELADYNVMANPTIPSVGADTIANGVLRKHATREHVYVNGTGGTQDWQISFNVLNSSVYYQFDTNRTNAYIELVFFGTGFDFRGLSDPSASNNSTVSLNGTTLNSTNFPTASASNIGAVSFNLATGVFNQNAATSRSAGFSVRNLPLATYRLRINNNTTNFLYFNNIDVVTPIHAPKLNESLVLQNTITVGSNALTDSRKLSPVKDLNVQTKNISQAVGIQNNPTNTSTSYVPLPDMSLTHNCKTGKVRISFNTNVTIPTNTVGFRIQVNGVAASIEYGAANVTNLPVNIPGFIVNVPLGVQKFDIFWAVSTGTATAINANRTLTVEDV